MKKYPTLIITLWVIVAGTLCAQSDATKGEFALQLTPSTSDSATGLLDVQRLLANTSLIYRHKLKKGKMIRLQIGDIQLSSSDNEQTIPYLYDIYNTDLRNITNNYESYNNQGSISLGLDMEKMLNHKVGILHGPYVGASINDSQRQSPITEIRSRSFIKTQGYSATLGYTFQVRYRLKGGWHLGVETRPGLTYEKSFIDVLTIYDPNPFDNNSSDIIYIPSENNTTTLRFNSKTQALNLQLSYKF